MMMEDDNTRERKSCWYCVKNDMKGFQGQCAN